MGGEPEMARKNSVAHSDGTRLGRRFTPLDRPAVIRLGRCHGRRRQPLLATCRQLLTHHLVCGKNPRQLQQRCRQAGRCPSLPQTF